MPTGNEYNDVQLGGGDQSYKQTDREMSGGVEPQIGGPAGPSSSGSYPQVYDRQAGSEPLGTPSDDNPYYYPQEVFNYIKCTGPGQSYVGSEREQISGEYGMCKPMPTGPYPGDNMVPSSVPSKQFSSNKEGNPGKLLEMTRRGVEAHADLLASYGLNQPVATVGSHPWLRDELSNTSEREAGNAEPAADLKIPKRQST